MNVEFGEFDPVLRVRHKDTGLEYTYCGTCGSWCGEKEHSKRGRCPYTVDPEARERIQLMWIDNMSDYHSKYYEIIFWNSNLIPFTISSLF